MRQHGFYDRLVEQTEAARLQFMHIPVIVHALTEGVPRSIYLSYLEQAYHHVRHTCPLLAAALSRCTAHDGRYRDALFEYLQEERGHEVWILNDIEALGGDAAAVRDGEGGDAVRVMVGYGYHVVERVSPYALLGMVHVLEGMSVALAERVATSIRTALGEDARRGFSYLESHGALDQEHVAFFKDLVNGIDDAEHGRAIIDTARIMYRLFGDVFRDLRGPMAAARHAA